jgi:hypothetical protein
VDREIARSQELGSKYYTLTYQPHEGDADGKFRRIRVTLRDPNLHAVTKAGYFAPNKNAPLDTRQQTIVNLIEAARSTIPFQALDLAIDSVVRHPDTRTIEFTVLLKPRNRSWEAADDGKSTTDLMVAAASLNGNRDLLASRLEPLVVIADTQDAARLAGLSSRLPVIIRVPRKTQIVRVVVQTEKNGRIGAAELNRKAIDAAPEAPTPEPKLTTRSTAAPSTP